MSSKLLPVNLSQNLKGFDLKFADFLNLKRFHRAQWPRSLLLVSQSPLVTERIPAALLQYELINDSLSLKLIQCIKMIKTAY